MRQNPRPRPRETLASPSAFTLVELLVVIVIIGILMGILLPAVNAIRAQARRAAALTQIRAIAQACHAYESDYGFFPPESLADNDDGHEDVDTPAESLWFFLSKKVANKSSVTQFNEAHAAPEHDFDEATVFGTKNTGPYYSPATSDTEDYDGDGVSAIVDTWGYPILYNTDGGPWGDAANDNKPFHNENTFDLFSVGPNGTTRELNDNCDFEEAKGKTYRDWVAACLDVEEGGNDTMGRDSNTLADERDRDDVNNWNTE